MRFTPPLLLPLLQGLDAISPPLTTLRKESDDIHTPIFLAQADGRVIDQSTALVEKSENPKPVIVRSGQDTNSIPPSENVASASGAYRNSPNNITFIPVSCSDHISLLDERQEDGIDPTAAKAPSETVTVHNKWVMGNKPLLMAVYTNGDFVSGTIRSSGAWENDELDVVMKALNHD